ncbi:hypothetical protein GCM10009544_66550 [Streptomyces stramineus]|uniref:Uncharacterized protein n=1 Tax=Streptomyces stramineus TaxID=173861 RepID=A0ABP3LD98_9ACTN
MATVSRRSDIGDSRGAGDGCAVRVGARGAAGPGEPGRTPHPSNAPAGNALRAGYVFALAGGIPVP